MIPEPPIRLSRISHRFNAASVLTDISLRVEPGAIAVVIGGSGSGKTTLLRIIVGLLQPTSGQVWIDGQEITAMSEKELEQVRAKFGVVFQYSALLDSLSVMENVALPLHEHTRLAPDDPRPVRRHQHGRISRHERGHEDRRPALPAR